MSIDCAFYGFLAADAEPRTSQAGKLWVRLRIGVGKDDDVQWVSVAAFGKAAENARVLKKADRVYVEGTLKLDTWRGSNGTDRSGLSVASFKLEPTHQIGRNRPRRIEATDKAKSQSLRSGAAAGNEFHNDEIPF
jgi:single-stranded DNA-binding protein